MSNNQLNITQEQVEREKLIHNQERETINEFRTKVYNLGLSTLEYRKDSQPKTKERSKKARMALKTVESNPELAKAAGWAVKDGQLVPPVNIGRS